MDIFDPLRKKYVRQTPEEEVRQNVIRWLNTEIEIPLAFMASEYSFTFNRLQYRADIVVFDRTLNPLVLVECKAPSVRIDQNAVDQVIRYNSVLKVRFIFITNGKTSYLCAWNSNEGHYDYVSQVPHYQEMLKSDINHDRCSKQ
ncbi:MAG: type I restriction enzyme HsdR N-terminal domain-containing protein [Bacteroidales bacterium]|nr:type I restriction enzyme HsdR N-terminal domain-containing protein [Bacteroidales bacterium]MDD4670528.1 type I restriction enzyme HsdR N-terminal domain-containing protein [Bacteroidales bacterium]